MRLDADEATGTRGTRERADARAPNFPHCCKPLRDQRVGYLPAAYAIRLQFAENSSKAMLHPLRPARTLRDMSTEAVENSDPSPTPSPSPQLFEVAPATTPGSLLRSSGPAPARRPPASFPPARNEVLDCIYPPRNDGDFSPERALDEQIAELETWAVTNLRAEQIDMLRFWGTRVLAFLGAGLAAVAAALEATEVACSSAVFASFAIVVDTAWPAASDRIARRRATRELRELQHQLKLKWDKVRLAHPNPNAPKRIAHALVLLDQIQLKREDVGRYLSDASPGVAHKLGSTE